MKKSAKAISIIMIIFPIFIIVITIVYGIGKESFLISISKSNAFAMYVIILMGALSLKFKNNYKLQLYFMLFSFLLCTIFDQHYISMWFLLVSIPFSMIYKLNTEPIKWCLYMGLVYITFTIFKLPVVNIEVMANKSIYYIFAIIIIYIMEDLNGRHHD